MEHCLAWLVVALAASAAVWGLTRRDGPWSAPDPFWDDPSGTVPVPGPAGAGPDFGGH